MKLLFNSVCAIAANLTMSGALIYMSRTTTAPLVCLLMPNILLAGINKLRMSLLIKYTYITKKALVKIQSLGQSAFLSFPSAEENAHSQVLWLSPIKMRPR